jgi:starch synthase
MMGLSRELQQKGHTVDIYIPKYDCLVGVKEWTLVKKDSPSFYQGKWHANHIYKTPLNGDLEVTAFESCHERRFFERGAIYGFPDDVDRFLYFSRACLDSLMAQKKVPDILHIHDWEVAAIAFLIREPEFREHFKKTKVILTIHNMEYQGWCADHNLDAIGMKGPYDKLKMPFSKDVNLLKGGIMSADAVTTVSETYAKEVMTSVGGKGLDGVLRENRAKFSGIVNGLDYTYWNPAKDRFLDDHYSVGHMAHKLTMKKRIQEELKLDRGSKRPLLATICRLVPQKGVDLIGYAVEKADDLGIQCVVLGSTSDPKIEADFRALQNKYATSQNVRILLKNEETLAHRLYAASDLFFVPSIFEPCGLTQMIALRYGAPPIVRKTGGLADTVFDVEYSKRPFEETNGFVFDFADKGGVDFAVKRAVSMYTNDPTAFHKLQRQGMEMDYSWNKPADLYLELYKKLLLC